MVGGAGQEEAGGEAVEVGKVGVAEEVQVEVRVECDWSRAVV